MLRLPGLDLLRAIAIVWVMLFHSYIIGGVAEPFAYLQWYGWIGVDIFFVLSGYLIGVQVLKPLGRGEPLRFGDFYWRRSLRVLPAYTVLLALYFLWPEWRERPGIQPLWQFLTYTVNLLIDYAHNQAFSHIWSLCVEEHFYLVFPWLAWWLTRRPSWAKSAAVAFAVVVGGMLLRDATWQPGGTPFVERIYYPTYNRLDGLFAGVVLAAAQVFRPALWQALQRRADKHLLPLGVLVIALAMWLFNDRIALLPSVFGYPLLSWGIALLVVAATTPHGILARLTLPGVGWLARISYSLYLSHKLVYHFVLTRLPVGLAGHAVLVFVSYASAILLGGAALYYAVERPFLGLRDRLRKHASSTRHHGTADAVGKTMLSSASPATAPLSTGSKATSL